VYTIPSFLLKNDFFFKSSLSCSGEKVLSNKHQIQYMYCTVIICYILIYILYILLKNSSLLSWRKDLFWAGSISFKKKLIQLIKSVVLSTSTDSTRLDSLGHSNVHDESVYNMRVLVREQVPSQYHSTSAECKSRKAEAFRKSGLSLACYERTRLVMRL
jgi:hypothetical protein